MLMSACQLGKPALIPTLLNGQSPSSQDPFYISIKVTSTKSAENYKLPFKWEH